MRENMLFSIFFWVWIFFNMIILSIFFIDFYRFHSLWLNNFPLYRYITFSLFIWWIPNWLHNLIIAYAQVTLLFGLWRYHTEERDGDPGSLLLRDSITYKKSSLLIYYWLELCPMGINELECTQAPESKWGSFCCGTNSQPAYSVTRGKHEQRM